MGLRGPFSVETMVETMVVTSKFAGGSSRCSLQPLLGFRTSVSVFFLTFPDAFFLGELFSETISHYLKQAGPKVVTFW